MFRQEDIPFRKYQTSTEKKKYHSLFENDDERKGVKNTDKNEGFIDYGNDLINCENIHDGYSA